MTEENVTNLNLKTLDDLALSKARSIDDMVTKVGLIGHVSEMREVLQTM